MNQNTQHVKALYEDATDVYLRATGYYIHGCAPPEGFNLPMHILNLLNVKAGGCVLDAGCGMGMMLIEMSKIRPDIKFYGITISERQFEICNELKSSYQADNVTFVLGDFHQLTNYFENQSMDAVYFNESLFHSNQYKQVLSEVYHILNHQGVLYSKDFYINRWLDKYFPFTLGNKLIKYIRKVYYYHPIMKYEMIKTIKSIGYDLKSFEQPAYIPDFQKVVDFEKTYKLVTYQLIQRVNAIHWRELIAIKK